MDAREFMQYDDAPEKRLWAGNGEEDEKTQCMECM